MWSTNKNDRIGAKHSPHVICFAAKILLNSSGTSERTVFDLSDVVYHHVFFVTTSLSVQDHFNDDGGVVRIDNDARGI